MTTLRSIPTFIRLGLGWWLVLVAYPLSRPWALYGLDAIGTADGTVADGTPLVLWSLGHALVAAWVLVRVLRRWNRQPTATTSVAWALVIACFAIDSWWLAVLLRGFVFGGWSGDSASDEAVKTSHTLVMLPIIALIGLWFITWPLLALGWLTAFFFRQLDGRPAASEVVGGNGAAQAAANAPPTP